MPNSINQLTKFKFLTRWMSSWQIAIAMVFILFTGLMLFSVVILLQQEGGYEKLFPPNDPLEITIKLLIIFTVSTLFINAICRIAMSVQFYKWRRYARDRDLLKGMQYMSIAWVLYTVVLALGILILLLRIFLG